MRLLSIEIYKIMLAKEKCWNVEFDGDSFVMNYNKADLGSQIAGVRNKVKIKNGIPVNIERSIKSEGKWYVENIEW